MKTVTVVHCWSAPRSRSTALLYSFEARGRGDGGASSPCGGGVAALDEPLYVEWLRTQKKDAAQRPYRAHLLSGTPPDDCDPGRKWQWTRERWTFRERLQAAALKLPETGGVIFAKQMAKFASVYDFVNELDLTSSSSDDDESATSIRLVHRHLLLLRDPVAVLASWGAAGPVHGDDPKISEIGMVDLLHIYSTLHSHGKDVVVMDSDELVTDPEGVLQSVCSELGIEYKESMMTWPAGPHDCDGPWAQWWYADVWKSDGWKRSGNVNYYAGGRYRTVNPDYMTALRASFPAFEYLKSLTRRHKLRGPPASECYEDPRNEHVLVWIGAPGRGRVIPRDLAGISPWDSAVQGGDAAWEGLRVYRGKILSLDKHLRRLQKSAQALGFENVHSKEEIVEAIFRVLAANGMRDGAHMRLTLTRGEKVTSSMNPVFNKYGTTLIILPEWKPTEGATTYDNTSGISLISASQRRNSPQTVDSKIHHNNLINNILPKIQANLAGCADAIMLDLEGYVSETNATNLFMVNEGVLLTPHADHCLPGITRTTVLTLAKELDIPTEVRRISLAEFHSADEVFTTGTMGELTPVVNIDGRLIGGGKRGPITERLQKVFKTLPERDGWATELPLFEA